MSNEKEIMQQESAIYVIQLVAAAINNAQPPEKRDDISWKDVIDFARAQSVLNIIAYSCEKLSHKPDAETMQFLREFRKQKIVVEAEQQIEAEDAMDRLEEMKIRHMALKGFVVKNLYPSPDMRTMGDIDILVDSVRMDDIVEAFKAEGFSFSGHGDLHSNIERGNVHFEFHRALVNKSYKNLTAYFGNGFDRALKTDGCEYRYELSREDMYIYLLAHLAKHYRYGGTGIRTVLDLYVYRRAYPDLDMEYILRETSEIGIDKFEKKVEAIADNWFSGSFDGELNSVSAYIISGGVYGKHDLNVVNEMINENKDKSIAAGKVKQIIHMIFPGYGLMSEWFPILKKFKVLLPVFWVFRWFKSVTEKNSNLKKTISTSVEIINADDKLISAQIDAELGEL